MDIVITGGTSGIGYRIAKDLIAEGHQVIIIGQDAEKGRASVAQLGKAAFFIQADLATKSGRNQALASIKYKVDKIHVLVHTAGVFPSSTEENIKANLVPHYQLTMGLADRLTGCRVLIVTGDPQIIQQLSICEEQETTLQRARWLLTHKALLTLFLSYLLAEKEITVNSFFPGNVTDELPHYSQTLLHTEVPVGKYLALHPDLTQSTGNFFDNDRNLVLLNARQYNYDNAEKHLLQYLTE